MRYIHLNDDSYIIHTSKGLVTLTRKSFNFNKIKRMLKKGVEEEDIFPLLTTPPLTDGIYEAYLNTDEQYMCYLHTQETPKGVTQTYLSLNGVQISKLDNDKFVGIYASKQDLLDDWPEYRI